VVSASSAAYSRKLGREFTRFKTAR
jgi:hypothetical protein